MTDAQPSATSLIERHRALGARLVDFAGWEMPVQYSGILEEHRAVRENAGLFDVSHMGELWVEGPEAAAALAHALVSDPVSLQQGRAQYSMICAEDGGVIDDLIVYRLGEERFLVVANAGNAKTVAAEIEQRLGGFDASLDDASARTSLLALQGPRSLDIISPLSDTDFGGMRYYSISEAAVAGIPAHVARTGYTGEDGFEIFVEWDAGPDLWDALMTAGSSDGISPVGLGARDTLRLEAGMPLYGNELSRDTNPYEAGLGRVVRLDKPGGFVGRHALAAASEGPFDKQLCGLKITGRGIARHGYPVFAAGSSEAAGDATGVVTSGTRSPTLGVPIAMAYVRPTEAPVGTELDIEIRDKRVAAEVVPLPFYKKEA